jgi:hypothetical protein
VLPGAGDDDRDADADGLTDAFEALAGTDPHRKDTDRDELGDGVEALQSRTDPRRADTDGDGVRDGAEVDRGTEAGTLAHAGGVSGTGAAAQRASEARDADADGLSDLHEKLLHTDDHQVDSDEDHLSDALELALGTDPLAQDSDGDGVADGLELRYDSDPLTVGGTFGQGPGQQGLDEPDSAAAVANLPGGGHEADLDLT